MGELSSRDYYDRQLRVPGWGLEGQSKLNSAAVLVVGVGGLGCPALAALARSGVGTLVFADADRVEASNLPRQTLFSPADIGRRKVEAAAQALASMNPWVKLKPLQMKVDASNVRALVEGVDLVVEGTDNFATKFLVHDACRAAGKPLVLASLYQWEAQLTVFAFDIEEAGCWRCLYPTPPEDGCVGVCSDVGVAGALASMAGDAQALASVRRLLGQAGPPPRSTWVFDAVSWTSRTLKWKTNPSCSCATGRNGWSWLKTSAPSVQAPTVQQEAFWSEIPKEDRRVVVDIREPFEVRDDEWQFFREQGSLIVHARWTQWAQSRPDWDPDTSYVLVCAHGMRSAAALKTVPAGIRAVSLAGGTTTLFHKV